MRYIKSYLPIFVPWLPIQHLYYSILKLKVKAPLGDTVGAGRHRTNTYSSIKYIKIPWIANTYRLWQHRLYTHWHTCKSILQTRSAQQIQHRSVNKGGGGGAATNALRRSTALKKSSGKNSRSCFHRLVQNWYHPYPGGANVRRWRQTFLCHQ